MTELRRSLARTLLVLAVATTAMIAGPSPAAAAEVDIAYEVGSLGDVSTPVDEFAAHVGSTLDHPDGWSLGGSIDFVPVREGAELHVVIAEPAEIGAISGCSAKYSCHVSGTVYINEDRWNQGAAGWSLSLDRYRHYVVNHEVGHYLELDHVACPGAGAEAPVMMQQTIETDPCVNRVWPLPYERQAVADRYGVTVRDDVSDAALGFVEQAYERLLQRSPSAEAADDTARRLDAGEITRAQVLDGLFGSQEFDATTAAVGRLYFATFLRAPEPGGLFYWSDQAQSGRSLRAIAADFASSQEILERYGDLDAEGFVERLYLNVLGRSADPEGEEYWVSRLESGELGRGDVLDAFAQSTEHRERRGIRVMVSAIYATMLDRAGDREGVDHWTRQLRSGTPRIDLVATFLNSEDAVF